MARPSKYKPEFVEKVYELASQGLTDRMIFQTLGVGQDTFLKWKKTNKEFYDSYKKGQEASIDKVENLLFKSAEGFYVEEQTTIIKIVDGREHKEIKKHKKYINPSITAQIFILKNKREKDWKDRQETKIEGDLNVATTIKVNEIDIEKVKKEKDES